MGMRAACAADVFTMWKFAGIPWEGFHDAAVGCAHHTAAVGRERLAHCSATKGSTVPVRNSSLLPNAGYNGTCIKLTELLHRFYCEFDDLQDFWLLVFAGMQTLSWRRLLSALTSAF
jgi:hypothetical protein